jgi:ADP-ribosylglycohydrolase
MCAMNVTADQFAGCMLGLATGDALGAPYEGGPLERLVWRVIGRTSDGRHRWTDDTQMALDLAASLLEEDGVQPEAIARRFASGYRWSRGYGPGAARVLKRIRRGEGWEAASRAVYAEGSYGNGAAMRAPVLALFFARDRAGLLDAARASAMITHAHPLGIDGAVLIASAAHALLEGRSAGEALKVVQSTCSTPEMAEKLARVASWIASAESRSPRDAAAHLGNGITALTSCPTALYVALRHLSSPFDEMMQFIIRCGGDVDTIGAMAGALWGIANGAARLPSVDLEARDEILDVASQLFRRQAGAPPREDG